MKSLFLLDRPNSPVNIDLFRLWEGGRHFREIDLYTLNDLLSGNIIEAPQHFNRDAPDLYQIEISVIPAARDESGFLRFLGGFTKEYLPTSDDLSGEDMLDTHQLIKHAVQNTVMDWGLRLREPALLEHSYLEYGQLQGNLDPIVAGIGTYALVDDRGRTHKRYHKFKITVVLMLKGGLMDEVIRQLDPSQVQTTDNWGNNRAGGDGDWDHISEAGLGNHELYKAIKDQSFDQVVFLKPGFE